MKVTRRGFLKTGVAGAATSWLMNLPTIANAAEGEDYKALVCVFLSGGNDHNNTVIPYDADNYIAYKSIRPEVAVSQQGILPLLHEGTLPFNQKLGLNENMSGMQALFNAGNMAVQLNVGPLFQPVTKAEYETSKEKLPPKLFSHNDQRSIWQASHAEGAKRGWGGVSGDSQLSQNTNGIFSCISISGNSVFLSGEDVSQFTMSSKGIKAIIGSKPNQWVWGSQEVAKTLRQLLVQETSHPMMNEFVKVNKRAMDAESIINKALTDAGVVESNLLPEEVVKLELGSQLNMVAKIIKARQGLGVKRQVFFVKLKGFDNHDNLVGLHGGLLKQLSDSLKAFYDATEAMGIANNVTAFTASDFGRTFVSNGDGSDHGWGSHHFVVGGAVKGKQFYGTAPEIALGTKDDIGKGRLLPSTSVDQYAATLASWFGVPNDQLSAVAPNLANFSVKNLGFV